MWSEKHLIISLVLLFLLLVFDWMLKDKHDKSKNHDSYVGLVIFFLIPLVLFIALAKCVCYPFCILFDKLGFSSGLQNIIGNAIGAVIVGWLVLLFANSNPGFSDDGCLGNSGYYTENC